MYGSEQGYRGMSEEICKKERKREQRENSLSLDSTLITYPSGKGEWIHHAHEDTGAHQQ